MGGPPPKSPRAATGLAGDEFAGGGVPAVQAGLEVDVEAAGGDVAQVDGGRAEAADVAHRSDQRGDDGGLLGAGPAGS